MRLYAERMSETPAKKPVGTVRIVLGIIGLVIAVIYLIRAVLLIGSDAVTEAGTLAGMVVFALAGLALLLTGLRAKRR